MLEQGLTFYVIILIVVMTLFVASFLIPFFGFVRKRWKGLVLGCMVQPFVCATAIVMAVGGIIVYQHYDLGRHRKAAMVSVRRTALVDSVEHTHTWHLKADGECLYEYRTPRQPSIREQGRVTRLFDVIRLDSTDVCVDDHVVVRFDLARHGVTATDYGEPLDVVSVDWDRVQRYLTAHP